MSCPSISEPLRDIISAYIAEAANNANIANTSNSGSQVKSQITPEMQHQAFISLTNFIVGRISQDIVKQEIMSLIRSIEPLEKIIEIFSVSEMPISFTSKGRENKGARRQKAQNWTTYEDQRLLNGIFRYGTDNWGTISHFVGNGRTRSQCAQRWNRGLNPSIFKGPWTTEEEETLMDLIAQHGTKSWKKVASFLKNRSDVQCRYHFLQMRKGICVSAKFQKMQIDSPLVDGEVQENSATSYMTSEEEDEIPVPLKVNISINDNNKSDIPKITQLISSKNVEENVETEAVKNLFAFSFDEKTCFNDDFDFQIGNEISKFSFDSYYF